MSLLTEGSLDRKKILLGVLALGSILLIAGSVILGGISEDG